MEVVGRIVTNFGGTEDSLRYLDWQPTAALDPKPTWAKLKSRSAGVPCYLLRLKLREHWQ
jgi:hypothetical protein